MLDRRLLMWFGISLVLVLTTVLWLVAGTFADDWPPCVDTAQDWCAIAR